MLENALLFDAAGQPIRQDQRTHSKDWDEVQEFCREVYMPYRVTPLGRKPRPDATSVPPLIASDLGQALPIGSGASPS